MNYFETMKQNKTNWRKNYNPSRRQAIFQTIVSALATVVSVPSGSLVSDAGEPSRPPAQPKPVDLRPPRSSDGYRRVRAVIQVEGKLKVNADGQGVRHVPLKGEAEWDFTQRTLSHADDWLRVHLVRRYHTARSQVTLHRSPLEHQLREERRLLVVESGPSAATLFSPYGSLTADELDLLDGVASGVALECLLPPRLVLPGGQWTARDAAIARLLGLDAVASQEVTFTLQAVEESIAIIALEGKVSGAAEGVASEIELKGKMNFDLLRRLVTWLALAYREDRAIGHAQPGYEVVATLRMVAAPAAQIAELSDPALAGLPLKADPGTTLIEYTSPAGGFQLAHDRRWHVMLERPDLTVLRLVDRGDLVAQCNIAPRPSLPAGRRLTLAAFQEDVRRALGQQLEQIVEAGEETDDSGLVVLRVLVAGVAGEIPIQWTYYHLSDAQGCAATLVFTLESSLLERFAALDRELIASFRFVAPPQPTPAAGSQPQGAERPGVPSNPQTLRGPSDSPQGPSVPPPPRSAQAPAGHGPILR